MPPMHVLSRIALILAAVVAVVQVVYFALR
jgi:hypothetical protein